MQARLTAPGIKLNKTSKIWNNKPSWRKISSNTSVKSLTRKSNTTFDSNSLSNRSRSKRNTLKNWNSRSSSMSKTSKWRRSQTTELITSTRRVFKKNYKLRRPLKGSKRKLELVMLEWKMRERSFWTFSLIFMRRMLLWVTLWKSWPMKFKSLKTELRTRKRISRKCI